MLGCVSTCPSERCRHAGKKLNVLSFGEDAEEDGDMGFAAGVRFRSAHEMLRGDSKLQAEEVGVHDASFDELRSRLEHEQVCDSHNESRGNANHAICKAQFNTFANALFP
jgi:hypothetical protein